MKQDGGHIIIGGCCSAAGTRKLTMLEGEMDSFEKFFYHLLTMLDLIGTMSYKTTPNQAHQQGVLLAGRATPQKIIYPLPQLFSTRTNEDELILVHKFLLMDL